MPPLIRTFSLFCREKYGHGVGKIPLDLGVSCPNRERGGCIYCRPASYTPSCLQKADNLATQIAKAKVSLLKGRFSHYFGYFQQETPTAMPAAELLPICREVLGDNNCHGLIIATRPDYLDRELLDALADLIVTTDKSCLFELGVQTVHQKSLALLNRNHDFEAVISGVERLREYGCFRVGAHLIFGIPGESRQEMLDSLQTVCSLGFDALKLHHLQVIRNTPMEDLFSRGQVDVFTLEEYLQLLLDALPRIPQQVVMHRLWASAHPQLLVAPKWQVLAAELSTKLQEKMREHGLWQGKYAGIKKSRGLSLGSLLL